MAIAPPVGLLASIGGGLSPVADRRHDGVLNRADERAIDLCRGCRAARECGRLLEDSTQRVVRSNALWLRKAPGVRARGVSSPLRVSPRPTYGLRRGSFISECDGRATAECAADR